MTVVLREWETFAGSNTPVVGATVQARAASNTHPNTGTVVASTTTNASGMWEFTSLADGTYDISIVYNGRTRWRKGNSLFSNSLTGANFATQTANKIFGGPASGGAASPTFRDLVAADFPAALWSTWTAVSLVQSVGLTFTATRLRSITMGKLVVVQFNVAITSAGTAANAIIINLPAALTAPAAGYAVGSFHYFDASVGVYSGVLFLVGTQALEGIVHGAPGGALGVVPNFAAASGDAWTGTATYELA